MKRLLVLLVFLLPGMNVLAQQPGNANISFDDRAPVPQGAQLFQYSVSEKASTRRLDYGVKKNVADNSNVGFLPHPLNDRSSFLVVSSDYPKFSEGFPSAVSSHTVLEAGGGTVASYNSGMWNFADRGPVAATVKDEDTPHEINSNTLYLNTFYDDSALVSQTFDAYSRQSQDARYAGTGYYFGSLMKAIDARGRSITSTLERLAERKGKFD